MNGSVQTDIGAYHTGGCRFAGLPISGRASLDHEHCCCDPDGSKAQAHLEFMRRYERRNVLSQTELWWPKGAPDDQPIRVEDMSLRYKKNLLAFLERRADHLKFRYELDMVSGPQPSGDGARDLFDRELTGVLEAKPVTWLYSMPFVENLERLVREEADGPID